MITIVSMKRIFMALAILSTLTFASCGSGETTESTTTEVVTDTTSVDSTNAECETDSVK